MSFTILMGCLAFVSSVIWLVIGWRAMKAHESLAESVDLLRGEVKKLAAHSTPPEKRDHLPKLPD